MTRIRLVNLIRVASGGEQKVNVLLECVADDLAVPVRQLKPDLGVGLLGEPNGGNDDSNDKRGKFKGQPLAIKACDYKWVEDYAILIMLTE